MQRNEHNIISFEQQSTRMIRRQQDKLIVDFPTRARSKVPNELMPRSRAGYSSRHASVGSARPSQQPQVQLESQAKELMPRSRRAGDGSRRASVSSACPSRLPQAKLQSQPQPQLALRKKSVSFSEGSTMVKVRYPSDREISRRWYTEEEMNGFGRKMRRDARRQSAVYIATKSRDPNALLPVEEVIKCVGLVHLLSDDVEARYQEFKMNRRTHSGAVLGEQDRQIEMYGCVRDTELANFSMVMSKTDKMKAIKAAILSGSAKPTNRRSSC